MRSHGPLFGTIDVNDFNFMRERMKLASLDLSGVTIVANGSDFNALYLLKGHIALGDRGRIFLDMP